MKIAVVSFTKNGSKITEKLVSGLGKVGYETAGYMKSNYSDLENTIILIEEPLSDWAGEQFKDGTNLIFIGAVGIAVRMIAPYLEGKDRDPAVVVVDEQGTFSISLLSGHLGGANDLARETAAILEAIPVITTATDLNHKFAVDLFAKKNNLVITDLSLAKEISAAVLREEEVGFFSDFPVEGDKPDYIGEFPGANCRIRITIRCFHSELKTLFLIPKAVVLGIGCRKGTSHQAISEAVNCFLVQNEIRREALTAIASIDLKKEESGLIEYAKAQNLTFYTYSKDELEQMQGDFTESNFVREVTGISNVCERAALCGCEGEGCLIAGKTVFTGITVAAAVKDRTFSF